MFSDLNVEHAQLVLILFHSLNFMQKKSVLLVTGSGAVRCSEAVKTPMKDSQLLHLSRLLLLLEYMMKHLYDAPPALLEQVSKHIMIKLLFLLLLQKAFEIISCSSWFISFHISIFIFLMSIFIDFTVCFFFLLLLFATGL